MKKILIPTAMALMLVSCAADHSHDFSIYGTVTDPELEGACIFLVPYLEKVIEPTKENLDSTYYSKR